MFLIFTLFFSTFIWILAESRGFKNFFFVFIEIEHINLILWISLRHSFVNATWLITAENFVQFLLEKFIIFILWFHEWICWLPECFSFGFLSILLWQIFIVLLLLIQIIFIVWCLWNFDERHIGFYIIFYILFFLIYNF